MNHQVTEQDLIETFQNAKILLAASSDARENKSKSLYWVPSRMDSSLYHVYDHTKLVYSSMFLDRAITEYNLTVWDKS